jgi:hypothetical protein
MTNHPNRKIPMTRSYVDGLRCSKGHGGNRGLYRVSRDSSAGFECAGCGAFYSYEFVCAAIEAARTGSSHSLIVAA